MKRAFLEAERRYSAPYRAAVNSLQPAKSERHHQGAGRLLAASSHGLSKPRKSGATIPTLALAPQIVAAQSMKSLHAQQLSFAHFLEPTGLARVETRAA